MLSIDPDEGLKIVLHAPIIIGQLWLPRAINGGRSAEIRSKIDI
jgi:hypothetical protein